MADGGSFSLWYKHKRRAKYTSLVPTGYKEVYYILVFARPGVALAIDDDDRSVAKPPHPSH